jgi:hypothetical protein
VTMKTAICNVWLSGFVRYPVDMIEQTHVSA